MENQLMINLLINMSEPKSIIKLREAKHQAFLNNDWAKVSSLTTKIILEWDRIDRRKLYKN